MTGRLAGGDRSGGPGSVSLSGGLRIGLAVPAVVLRLALAVIAAGVALLQFGPDPWLVIALVLVALGLWRPHLLMPWFFLGYFGVSMLWHAPSGHSLALYGIIAGAHLCHVLASLLLDLPATTRVQLRLLGRPLARYAIIQAVTQAVAIVVFFVLPATTSPVAPVVGAAALVALALMLSRRSVTGPA